MPLIFLYILLAIIFYYSFLQNSKTILSCTLTEYLDTKRGTCTYKCDSSSDTITAIRLDTMFDIADLCLSNKVKNGSNCSFDYSYALGSTDVVMTVEGKGSFTVTGVQCIFEDVVLKTMPPKLARDVTMEDTFLQLDNSLKKIKSIKKTLIEQSVLYEYQGAVVTEWHPVRLPDEKKYIVAKHHPLMTKVFVKNGFVYHFELENFTDDILFENSPLIAESWNDLPHGVEVNRL